MGSALSSAYFSPYAIAFYVFFGFCLSLLHKWQMRHIEETEEKRFKNDADDIVIWKYEGI